MNINFYLLLPWSESQPNICLIKICRAGDKDKAALHFQELLNAENVAIPYKKEEILRYVKAEDELTENDKKEIKEQGIIPDINFKSITLLRIW